MRLHACIMPHMENWLPVVGYGDLYEVSDFGNVRSLGRTDRLGRKYPPRMMTPSPDTGGYLQVKISRDGKQHNAKVHHLVLEAHVECRPAGAQCRHLDGNPANNRADNLAWGNFLDNALDRAKHGTAGGRLRVSNREAKVRQVRDLVSNGLSITAAAKEVGVAASTAWAWVTHTT